MGKPKQVHHKNVEHQQSNQYKKSFDPKLAHKSKDRCNKYVVTQIILRLSSAQ